ncbi:MAG: tetratricopeptide repeat protein [Elusimicrobia bacterium]|nr:tetratricopeptide repeat protein [Elusimicrobiota bacterium]
MKLRRTLALAAALFAAPFLGRAAQASTKASYMHYLKALLLANQGSHEGALKEYEEALELDPQSAFMYQQAAELALQMGRLDKARELADRFLKLDPGNPDAVLLEGNVAWAQGDLPAAQASFERVLELKGEGRGVKVSTGAAAAEGNGAYKQALFALANLLSAESPEKAKKYFEQYLIDNPDNASEAEYQIALIEQREGRLDSAAEHLKEAVRCSPDNAQARFALAQIYETKRDTEAALGVYMEILQSDPRNIALLNHVGELFFLRGESAKAREHFLRAKGVLRDHPAACLWLALLAEQERDFASAAKALEDSAALKDDASVNLRLSYYFTQAGRLKDAVGVLESAHRKWPDSEEIAYFLALGYDDMKLASKAAEMMLEVLKANPEHRDARFQLGAIYERGGRIAEAEAQFREILKRNALDAPALNYLGYSLADRGMKLEEAEEMIRRALDVDPKNGAYRDSLGWVIYKRGNVRDAIAELKAASKLLPEDEAIWDHLGEAYMVVGDTYTAWMSWKLASSAAPKRPDLAKKIGKAESRLSSEEIGALYLKLFARLRGTIQSLGAVCLIEGGAGSKTLEFRGLLRYQAPNELRVEILGPLFVPIFHAVLSGEDAFEMDVPRIDGIPPDLLRDHLYAALTLLRDYLSGKVFAQIGAAYRKTWRSQWIETPGLIFYPDETQTQLAALKPGEDAGAAAGPRLKLSLERFQRRDGHGIPAVFRFEGKGFSIEFKLSEVAVRFKGSQ